MLIEIENYNKFGNRLFHFVHKSFSSLAIRQTRYKTVDRTIFSKF